MTRVAMEWRDVRIQGTYTPVGGTTPITIDRVFRVAGQVDQFGVTNSIQATAQKQDVTPTYTQAAAGEAAFNVVSPVATDVYAALNGTHGLEESSDQPADLTRVYFATADTSRPHHVGCHRVAPYAPAAGAGCVGFSGGVGSAAPYTVIAMSDPGDITTRVILQESATPTFGQYDFNRATGNFEWVRAVGWPTNGPVASVYPIGTSTAVVAQNAVVPLRQTGLAIWMTQQGSIFLKDLVSGNTAPCDVTPIFTVRLGDRLHAFSVSGAGWQEIYPFDITANGATLTRTQTAALVNVTGHLYYTGVCMGACTSNGFIILATSNSLYSIAFDDTNRKYITSLIVDLPLGVTGRPVEWGGDVWVPCGSRIFRFSVGKSGNTWALVDTTGTLPDVYGNGDIVQLIPTPDRLVMRVARSNTKALLLAMDSGSAVSTLDWSDGADNTLGTAEWWNHPAIPVIAGGEPFVVRLRTPAAGYITAGDTTIIPNGSRNPGLLPAAQRRQKVWGAIHYPRNYGVNRQSPKTPVRLGVEVAGVGPLGSLQTVNPFIQYDEENTTAYQTFGAYGPLAGTGTWRALGAVGLETPGINPATGAGIAWFELPDQNGTYRRANTHFTPLITINGDPTGQRYPEIRSLIVQRYEWVLKGYLSSLRLRLATRDGDVDTQDEDKGGVLETADDVEAALKEILALNDHNVICTITPVGGDTTSPFRGVLTKYNEDTWHTDSLGRTYVIVSLSITHVIPAALYPEV